VYAVQQHQHRNLDFKHDNSKQHDLNDSEQHGLNDSQYVCQYADHQQRHGKFQFNRSFGNSLAAQRDVNKWNLGNGSDPLHAGQQYDPSRNYFNRAEQSAARERHGQRNHDPICQPSIFH
jgi:predicted metal-dependent peptidase